jgi:hypothetical protein
MPGGKKFISGTLVCQTSFVKQKLPLRADAKENKAIFFLKKTLSTVKHPPRLLLQQPVGLV